MLELTTQIFNSEWILSLFSGFVGGAAAVLIQIIIHQKQRNDAKRFLAIKLAFLLERYVIESADALAKHGSYKDSGGHAGEKLPIVPEFPTLPKSEDYRFMRTDLIERIFEFPQYQKFSQGEANFHWDIVGDPDSYTSQVVDNTIRCAVRALELAIDIRQAHKLPARSLEHGYWNIKEQIDEEMQELQKREHRRQEKHNDTHHAAI